MRSFRWISLCGISLAALLCCSAAFADTFSFNFSGSGFNGSGTFTANPTTTSGEYLITGISGTTNGAKIYGILAPNAYPPVTAGDFSNDNDLFNPLVDGGALDLNGFSYEMKNMTTDYNIYFYDGVYSLVTDANLDSYNLASFAITDTTTGTPIVGGGGSPSATPEPASLLLLGTAALGIAGTLRRRWAV